MYVPYKSQKIFWNILIDAARFGIEEGVESSVIKEILSTVGKAILEYYSPTIANVFFKSDEIGEATQKIIDEVRDTHSDLADRHREIFEEIEHIYRADIRGIFETALTNLNDWNSHSGDAILAMDNKDLLSRGAFENFTIVREKLEAYLGEPASDSLAQFKRLQLLPLHIEAARLEITTRVIYWNWSAIKIMFEAVHGSDSTHAIFEEWRDSLSQEDISHIQDIADGDGTSIRNTLEEVLSFYEAISERDDISNYIEDIFTPLVDQMETFNGNPNMYDNEIEINDNSNWGITEGGARPALDGARRYYYVDVPNAECLEGYAYRGTLHGDGFPYVEISGEPHRSECNRYWTVNPHSTVYVYPCNIFGSFDGYQIGFSDPFDIYELHKELVKGDLLREIYSPCLLILDAIHSEIYGGERPANNWDQALARYDEVISLLAVGNCYEENLEASEALRRRCGVTPQNPGLSIWFRMLQLQLEDPDNPPTCPDDYEENDTWEKAAIIQPGYYSNLNLNVPGDIDIFQFELLADNTALICLYPYPDETAFTSKPIMELWGQLPNEDEPTLISSATEHEEYGWSILFSSQSDQAYRHRKMKAFIKIYSSSDQVGTYSIALQTKGPELPSYAVSEPDSSDEESNSSIPTSGILGSDPIPVRISSSVTTLPGDNLFPTDDSILVREIEGRNPYRIEFEPEEGSPSVLLSDYRRSIALRSTIYTGGGWITNHSILGQTVGADIDRYVIEVPAGSSLEISILPFASNFGMPYVELEDRELEERATIDNSHWPEGGRTIRIAYPTSFCDSSSDVFFRVSGLFRNNYRRDTGGYKLTVALENNPMIIDWNGLCSLRSKVLRDLRHRIPDPHDLKFMQKVYVDFTILNVPDDPRDPYILAAIDYSTGKAIDTYEFKLSANATETSFREQVKAFNKTNMGLMYKSLIRELSAVPGKFQHH